MSKAILIMDMPENCKGCDLKEDTDISGVFCCPTDEKIGDGWDITDFLIKLDCCPLKPIKPNLIKALRCLASKDQYNYCYKTQYNRDRGDNPEMSCHGTIKSIPCPYHQDEYDTDFGSDGCQKLLNELADMLEGKEK